MKKINKELKSLLTTISSKLTSSDIDNINELINYGEFGTALELICSQLHEGNNCVTNHILNQIRELSILMKMDSSTWNFLEVSENEKNSNHKNIDVENSESFVKKQLRDGVSDFLIISILRSDYNFTYDNAVSYLNSIKP